MQFKTLSIVTFAVISMSGSAAFAAGGDSLEAATQRGANHLIADIVAFAKGNDCQACHRQGAGLFGLSEALSNGYTMDSGDVNGLGLLATQNVRHQGTFRGAPVGRYWHTGGANFFANSTSSYAGYGLAGYDRYVSTRYSTDLVEAADDAVLRQTVSGNLGYWAEEHHHFPTTFGYVQNAARHVAVLAAARARADTTRQAAYDAAMVRTEAYLRSRIADTTQSTGGAGYGAIGYTFQAAWALLGLKDIGINNSDPDVQALQARLLSTTSNPTGNGWGYSAGHAADPYNTGLALYALCRSGLTLGTSQVSAAANWLNSVQQASGQWVSPTHATVDVPTTFAMLGLGCFGSLGVEVGIFGPNQVMVSSNSPSPQTVSFSVVVSNTGAFGGADSYSLAVLGGLPGWNAQLSTQSITVPAGTVANVTLTVTTGTNLPPALPVNYSIRATSQTSASVSATANVTVYTDPPPPVVGLTTSVQITAAPSTRNVTFSGLNGLLDGGNSGLYKTGGGAAWNAGAYSNEQITSGNGWVEFVVDETTAYRMVGLSNGNTNSDYVDIDFAMYPAINGTLNVYENSVNRGQVGGTYTQGDVLRVEVNNGVVTYAKNGTVFYTSTKTATYPLNVDTSFYTDGGTAQDVRISTNGGTPVVATWTSMVNVKAPSTLTKVRNSVAWDSGAYSNEQILDGTGYLEFRATERTTHRMMGLSNGNTDNNWTDIDFAFYLVFDGTLQVRESGSGAIGVGTYQTNDLLRVEVTNGVVRYYKNGALLRTSPTAAKYPLNVDTSFYTFNSTLDGATLQGSLNAPVTSRTANTVLAARVYDQNGVLVQGPQAGVVTFYVAGVPVANDTDDDGDGTFEANWAPGSGWSATGQQDYRAIYSGIDRPGTQPDLLSSLKSTIMVLDLATDSDTDGLEDDLERDVVGTDPLVADTDGDGCLDGTEYNTIHSNPLVADTDGDGVGDCVEFNAGTDPLVGSSFPDADSDGVSDVADIFPCDVNRSAVAFVPAEGQYGQMLFEDNWPAKGDGDGNDLVFAYNYKLFRNSNDLVTGFVLTVEPLAMGATINSGLAIRLPVSATALLAAERVVGNGTPMSLVAPAGESEVVVVIAQDVREFFQNQAGLINVGSAPMIDAPQVQITMQFNAPFPLALGAEPFDLYFFHTLNERHQIHRPAYQGTDRMNTLLFGTVDDGSTPGRWFVDTAGVPFVISLPQLTPWTTEFTPMTSLFPNLTTFASSGGTQAQDFYSSQVDLAHAYPGSIGLVAQPGGIVEAIPSVVYDRSCTTIPLGF